MAILWKAGSDTSTDYSGSVPVVTPNPTFAGAVLGTTGRDVRIMSDVWAWVTFARVWDGSAVRELAVANSEFGTDAAVTVDATDDVKAAVAVFEAAQAAAAAKAARDAAVDRQIAWARTLAVGKDATVVRGRKIAKGTTGRVFWLGDTKFGRRAGLELADGSRVFTAASNVEVSNPDDHLDVDALIAQAA